MARTCPSCAHDLSNVDDAQYCSNCGQRLDIPRFSVRSIIDEFFSAFLNIEKGLMSTTIKLTTSPGEVVKGYLAGKTRKFYHPFRYALVMVTLHTILTVSTGVYDDQVHRMTDDPSSWNAVAAEGMTEDQVRWNAKLQEEIKGYLSLFTLIGIPIGAIGLWLLFRDKKLYFGEHLVSASYYIGHASLLSIPFTIIAIFIQYNPMWNLISSTVIYIGYGTVMLKWAYDVRWLRATASSIALLIISAVALTVLSLVVGVAIALIGGVSPQG